MPELTLLQRRADMRPNFYRVGGPRERCIWNGEQLVWVTERREPVPEPSGIGDDFLPPMPAIPRVPALKGRRS